MVTFTIYNGVITLPCYNFTIVMLFQNYYSCTVDNEGIKECNWNFIRQLILCFDCILI